MVPTDIKNSYIEQIARKNCPHSINIPFTQTSTGYLNDIKKVYHDNILVCTVPVKAMDLLCTAFLKRSSFFRSAQLQTKHIL